MRKQHLTTILGAVLIIGSSGAFVPTDTHAEEAANADVDGRRTLNDIEQEGLTRITEGQQAQQQVDRLGDQNRQLQDDYYAELKLVQGLETYIELLDQQLENQQEEISTLQRSITDVAVVERQILPLMVRMIDTLEQFVALDVPFLPDERRERVAKLRALMNRSDVAVAEKSRRVFEAYQIENEYGRTIESYTDKLQLPTGTFDAEFLRIGRLGLMYATVGASEVGYWDKASNSWQPLDRTPWSRMIDQGLKVARQEIAPQLIHVPLNPAQVEEQVQ